METKEWYFFKWAYPCMYVLYDNGSLTKEIINKFDRMYAEGNAPSKEELENLFLAAFRRLKVLASEMNKEVWDWDVLKQYWEAEDHNRVIEKKEGNYSKFDEAFCDLCKVNSGRVIKIENKNEGTILELEMINGRKKFVQGKFLDARIGDVVLTHLAYAVQKT